MREVRSSDFRRVCYRINILGSRLITVTKQYKFGTGVSWEGNRRSSVALAMRYRHRGLSIYGLDGQRLGEKLPRIMSLRSVALQCFDDVGLVTEMAYGL